MTEEPAQGCYAAIADDGPHLTSTVRIPLPNGVLFRHAARVGAVGNGGASTNDGGSTGNGGATGNGGSSGGTPAGYYYTKDWNVTTMDWHGCVWTGVDCKSSYLMTYVTVKRKPKQVKFAQAPEEVQVPVVGGVGAIVYMCLVTALDTKSALNDASVSRLETEA